MGESSALVRTIHLKSCNCCFGWDVPVYFHVPALTFSSSAAGSFAELQAVISHSFVLHF